MNLPATGQGVPTDAVENQKPRGRLFRKYAVFFAAIVCLALGSNTAMEVWFYAREYRTLLLNVQRAQAEATAIKIGQFVKEIESHLGWTTQPWSAASVEEWRLDAVRLLRQVPAIPLPSAASAWFRNGRTLEIGFPIKAYMGTFTLAKATSKR